MFPSALPSVLLNTYYGPHGQVADHSNPCSFSPISPSPYLHPTPHASDTVRMPSKSPRFELMVSYSLAVWTLTHHLTLLSLHFSICKNKETKSIKRGISAAPDTLKALCHVSSACWWCSSLQWALPLFIGKEIGILGEWVIRPSFEICHFHGGTGGPKMQNKRCPRP